MNLQQRSPRTVRASLEACGYCWSGDGGVYQTNGFSAVYDASWLTISAKVADQTSLLPDPPGAPGLWKTVYRRGCGPMRREFHLPLAAVSGDEVWVDDQPESVGPLDACLRWAEATARGELPAGWRSPPREQIESWIPHQGLVLRSGPLLKQGSLVCDSDRLTLCFTILNELPENLSAGRRRWLTDVLRESSDRWRMVRVGLEGTADRPAVKAEIDLSGAPHPVLEDLFRAGLDALRFVVSWFLWPVTFLADGRVACRAWETPRAGLPARKRERR